jgi:DNA-binding NtrC family response regulator
LASVIERAAILGGGRRLEVAAALGATSAGSMRPEPAPSRPEELLEARDFATLDRAMSRHIERALAVTRGRIEGARGAARLLGINPHTLRARMRRLGVDWRRFRTR